MFGKKHHFLCCWVYGCLWYVTPFVFLMNHLLGSIDIIDSRNLQVVFEELDREYLVSKVIQGVCDGNVEESRTWAKNLGKSCPSLSGW